ncbi:MAG: glycosyltransferase family 4 protein [Verrucomicrobia bacterium]|nr:glycosyltransferase family 4 protein [Verrucomicrobiota bacterium]
MDERIRILHVVLSLEPGGMENGVVNVARMLNPEEFEVHVACLERRGVYADRLPNPANCVVLDKPPGFSWPTVRRLVSLISRVQPHVIHSHNLGALVYSIWSTAWGFWKPILQGEHGQLVGEQGRPQMLRRRARYYARCAKVHTVSHSLRQHLVDLGLPAKRIVALVNGVDMKRFAPGDCATARRQIGIPVEGPVVGIVGRFDKIKRHAHMIEAFALLVRQLPGAQLLIVGGGGPERENVERLVRESPVGKQIHLVGFQGEPCPYYQAMDVLASPSIAEGLSNVILEAMACAVPVLCHGACGNTEVISHGVDGLVSDLKEVEGLARELHAALAGPERLAAMGRAARTKIEAKFSIANMVRQYEALYREIAGRR